MAQINFGAIILARIILAGKFLARIILARIILAPIFFGGKMGRLDQKLINWKTSGPGNIGGHADGIESQAGAASGPNVIKLFCL